MWIESPLYSTVRRRIVSPPGYQSPALGDSVPVPGSQEAQHVTLLPGVTTSRLSRVPRLFASIITTTRTRREADNECKISHNAPTRQVISPPSLPESGCQWPAWTWPWARAITSQRCTAMSIDTRIAVARFPGGLATHGLVLKPCKFSLLYSYTHI